MSVIAITQVLRLRWRDNDGAETFSLLNIGASVDYVSALSWLASFYGISAPMSTALIIGADLLIRYAENTNITSVDTSDTRRQGVFIFGESPDGLAVVRLPSILESVLMTSGPYAGIEIDQSLPAVAAFVAALTNGIGGVIPCDPMAIDLGDLATAYMQRVAG